MKTIALSACLCLGMTVKAFDEIDNAPSVLDRMDRDVVEKEIEDNLLGEDIKSLSAEESDQYFESYYQDDSNESLEEVQVAMPQDEVLKAEEFFLEEAASLDTDSAKLDQVLIEEATLERSPTPAKKAKRSKRRRSKASISGSAPLFK